MGRAAVVEAWGLLTVLPGGPFPPENAERAWAPVAVALVGFSCGAHARLRAACQRTLRRQALARREVSYGNGPPGRT
jgi:hypothetical protein